MNEQIFKELHGMNVTRQQEIDHALIELDGTDSKKHLGANAVLGTSIACAHAASNFYKMPLYRYIGGISANLLPMPMMNILKVGKL